MIQDVNFYESEKKIVYHYSLSSIGIRYRLLILSACPSNINRYFSEIPADAEKGTESPPDKGKNG